MKNHNGFSVLLVMIALLMLSGVAAAGALVYKHYVDKKASPGYASLDTSFHFSPVPIDTSDWVSYSPFQGFTLQRPPKWTVGDDGPFRAVNAYGNVTLSGPYRQVKTVHLFSPDFILDEGGTNTSLDSPSAGARIDIYMNTRISSDPTPDTSCSKQLLNYQPSQGCETIQSGRVSTTLTSSAMNYGISEEFSATASAHDKNYYISVFNAVVKSLHLY